MNDVVLGYALMLVRDKLQTKRTLEQAVCTSVSCPWYRRPFFPRARKSVQQSARRDSLATGAINRLL